MTYDDSALFHAGTYDAQKAHEYYLRTRQLKGRSRAAAKAPSSHKAAPRGVGVPRSGAGGKPNRADTKSRQEELARQKKALEARLDHLREVLSQLVDAAKKRSGVKEKPQKDTQSSAADSKSKSKKGGTSEKLSASEKAKKNEKARQEYEKEQPTSLSADIRELHAQVADIQDRIKKALADARERRTTAGQQVSKSGSQNNQTSGPRGR